MKLDATQQDVVHTVLLLIELAAKNKMLLRMLITCQHTHTQLRKKRRNLLLKNPHLQLIDQLRMVGTQLLMLKSKQRILLNNSLVMRQDVIQQDAELIVLLQIEHAAKLRMMLKKII